MALFRWLHFFELQRQWTTISLNSTERPGQEEQITKGGKWEPHYKPENAKTSIWLHY